MECLNCGKEITKKSHQKSKIRKFCNKDCEYEYKGFHPEPKKYVICQYCGKSFLEKCQTPNLYCSKYCTGKATTAITKIKYETPTQKNPYEDMLRYQLKELNARIEEIVHEIEYGKECVECGKYFIAKSKKEVCCSKKCSKRRTNRDKDRRIYKNGEPDTSITLTKLYMRDNGVCQICGKHIDFDCDPNSKYYPSIDHIQPIAKGGLHIWGNVQLACRKCNTIKRDTVNPAPCEF